MFKMYIHIYTVFLVLFYPTSRESLQQKQKEMTRDGRKTEGRRGIYGVCALQIYKDPAGGTLAAFPPLYHTHFAPHWIHANFRFYITDLANNQGKHYLKLLQNYIFFFFWFLLKLFCKFLFFWQHRKTN